MPGGELWRGRTAVALESSYGVPVAASRRTYFTDPAFERTRAPRPHMFATGTRDNTRAFTLGPIVSGAKSLKQPLSADEIIELLLLGVQGGVTPAGGVWSFTPASTSTPLDSATFEWFDGADGWQIAGCYVNKLSIKGSVDKENDVDAEVFGRTFDPLGALAEGLADRVPTVIEGWETLLYVDDFGATPGSTLVPGTLINWDITVIDNQLKRKYFADNTLNLGAVVTEAIKVSAKLTFEASAPAGLAEYGNWDAVTPRVVRVAFGNGNVVGGIDQGTVAVDIPGNWSAVDLGKTDNGTRVYEMTQEYLFDPANGFGVRVQVTNGRGSAWGA